jgi:hypothetical protein
VALRRRLRTDREPLAPTFRTGTSSRLNAPPEPRGLSFWPPGIKVRLRRCHSGRSLALIFPREPGPFGKPRRSVGGYGGACSGPERKFAAVSIRSGQPLPILNHALAKQTVRGLVHKTQSQGAASRLAFGSRQRASGGMHESFECVWPLATPRRRPCPARKGGAFFTNDPCYRGGTFG